MKKILAAILWASVCISASALANTYELPDEKPIAAVTIPGKRKPDQYEDGVEAVSDDGEVYLAVESTDSKNVKKAMEDAFKYLKKKGVKVKETSAKQSEGKLNDMDVVE